LLAACAAVPVGALVAIPANRLPGVFLGLATFGFAVLLEQFVYSTRFMFGVSIDGLAAPRPRLLGLEGDRGYYYLVLAVVVLTALTTVAIQYTRPGRLLRALADSPVALETQGATASMTRLMAFCISAFIAGLAGALLAGSYGRASSDSFSSFNSLVLFAVLMITFVGAPWYGFLASAGLTLVPSFLLINGISNYQNLAFGIVGILVPFYAVAHRGVPLPLRAQLVKLDSFLGRAHRSLNRPPDTEKVSAPLKHRRRVTAANGLDRAVVNSEGLRVENLTIRYGGLLAVSDVSLQAKRGQVTGLIGPNGAGKTSLFHACSGFVKPSKGRILYDGVEITHKSVPARARRGIGRTFQRLELWPSLTVHENVAMGREASMAGSNILNHVFSTPSARQQIAHAAEAALIDASVTGIRKIQARALSLGQGRMTELARCLAGDFEILLLDEPSSGLDSVSQERFATILREIVAVRNVGILLVEHDVPLVMGVCDYIYVLDAGRLIFEGDPQTVATSDVVTAAYLGTAAATGSAA
jgi:ABC-type branched-subunit amino acid transport system ATPase component/branched-subunit amino acid ABC-type transport system permease component